MRWTVHGERPLYESEWVTLALADVELPDGQRFEHHVVRMPGPAAATVVRDDGGRILLLRRHRFVPDRWGWEIPGGRVDAGEEPAEAAARETLEETGWRPGPIRELFRYHPIAGLSDWRFHVFAADGAAHVHEPDGVEVERIEWHPAEGVRELIRAGEISDGFSLTALLWYLTMEPAPGP